MLARPIKIDGDETWNVSEYDGEDGYFKISIAFGVNVRFKDATLPYTVREIHIEKYWKNCYDSIIDQLFNVTAWGKIKYETNNESARITVDYGHKLLKVDYQNKIHELKLPYCSGGGCGCYEPGDNQSGQRIKWQITRQLNDGIITSENQIWKIKDSLNNNRIITIDPSTDKDIARLWQNGKGFLFLSHK